MLEPSVCLLQNFWDALWVVHAVILFRPPAIQYLDRRTRQWSIVVRNSAAVVSRTDGNPFYVEEVIKTLEMESYADAIVGVPGEGEPQFHPFTSL